jgi:hypothetical protein
MEEIKKCPECGGQGQVDPAPVLTLPGGGLRMIRYITKAPRLDLNIAYLQGKVQIYAQSC